MNVLVGIGGTDRSFEALEAAIARAREADDDLTVAIYRHEDVDEPLDAIEGHVQDELVTAGIDAELRRIEDHAASQLVEIADGERFDRLVLAGGERSALGKIRIGDLVEFVLLNAETTVTLVR
ncbi:MAG: universal stress protein [Haloglomus sp.]